MVARDLNVLTTTQQLMIFKFEKRFCTSIVASQANGQIIHGRNLDYDFPEFLQNLTYMAKYYRNGTVFDLIYNAEISSL